MVKVSIAFAILSIDRSVYFYHELKEVVPWQALRFVYNCIANLSSAVFMMLPMFLFKYIFDRKEDFGLYGLKFKRVDFTPYWIMLAVMAPVMYAAFELFPDIANYYPTYRKIGGQRFADFYNISETLAIAIYETFYVSDFIFTELFFRGVLILGFVKLIGKNAVIPMAAAYCILHFGKPMTETISSIFGGYILGIIAMYSRNIWGGVFIHGGIALVMDLIGIVKMNG